MTDNEYINTLEVSQMLKCSRAYITLLVRRGHFPSAMKLDPTRRNSPMRILRSDVLAYQEKQLLSNSVKSPSEN